MHTIVRRVSPRRESQPAQTGLAVRGVSESGAAGIVASQHPIPGNPTPPDLSDEQILAKFVQCIKDLARRFASRRVGCEKDDLVQMGSLAALAAYRGYNPERGAKTVESYVWYKVRFAMLNTLDDWGGSESKAGITFRALFSDEAFTWSDPCDRHGLLELTQAAESLPDREAELITLIYFEGYRDVEVARRWGVTRQRIGQIKQEALDGLRRALERDRDEGGGSSE